MPPKEAFPGRWCFALRPVLVGVEMAVLDALTQEFQQPLQQDPASTQSPADDVPAKASGDEVQKAHGNDESPAKRQDESQVVDAPLAHQHKQPPPKSAVARNKAVVKSMPSRVGGFVCENHGSGRVRCPLGKCVIAPNV